MQADWTELSGGDVAALGLSGPVFGFGTVLCWARWRFCWFADSIDFGHTAEGLAGSFTDAGGVPAVVRIDNMGALVARAHPNLVLRPVARTLANHYGFTVAGCWPGDGARNGKVERPFRELKESFVQEMALDPPGSIGELNRRVGPWLDAVVHARPHRVTGQTTNVPSAVNANSASNAATHAGSSCVASPPAGPVHTAPNPSL